MKFALLTVVLLHQLGVVHGFVLLRPVVGAIDTLLDRVQRSKKYNQDNPLYKVSPNWFPLTQQEIANDHAVELELIQGRLPSDLNGVALRVGPNACPETGFNKKVNGIIDGDGMLHSVRLDGKKALYSAAWLDTPRRQMERDYGKAYFLKLGEVKGVWGIFKLLLTPLKMKIFKVDSELQLGQANTALFTVDDRHFALQENSIPFEFKLYQDGTFESVGYQDFGGALDAPFGAHPRLDPSTGKLFFCGYNPVGKPHLRWGVIAPSDKKNGKEATVENQMDVESIAGGCPFSHDFSMTENYVLILDNSVRFDFTKILTGDVVQFNEQIPLRFGISPKNATSSDEIMWYESETAMVLLHFVNAWEESEDVIKLWAPSWNQFVADVTSMEGQDPASIVRMTEFTFDLKDPNRRIQTRDVENHRTDNTAVDFPAVNHLFMGRKTDVAFAGIMKRNVIDFDGISKWFTNKDGDEVVQNIFHGTSVTGGEPVVAPKLRRSDNGAVYVLNFIYDSDADESYLVIYDGEDFREDKIVTKYRMPHRVPHGLHAKWVEADQLLPV